MKKVFTPILFLILLISSYCASAQKRYFDPMFNKVTVTGNIIYGANATILTIADTSIKQAVKQPLTLDLYTPEGDVATDRPLILYFHTGNFLPFPQNLSTSGTKRDSTCVDICTKLAKLGYVVASVDYRLGWNPTAGDKTTRVFTLINAAYRGVQDARTCIRYFKKSVNENGNPYGIDPSKIVLWGQGTGGYVTLTATALDSYSKIVTASNGKFTTTIGGQPVPMVLTSVNGDIYGTSVGIVPAAGYPPPFTPGDTLCYPNHVGYDSDFALSVNMGGAIADTAWIDPGQAPIIAIQCPYDPSTPYKEGIVIVPIPGNPLDVVEVQGSYLATKLSTQYGNNASFSNIIFNDPVSVSAKLKSDGIPGLFPIYGNAGVGDSSPWDFWAPTNPNNLYGLATNSTMSAAKGRAFIDSIITFYKYRACYALNLADCNTVATKEVLTDNQIGLEIGPNPSHSIINISTDAKYPIESAYLYDIKGNLVKAKTSINSNQYTLERFSLPVGNYFVNLHFKDGIITKQISFN